MAYQKLQVSDGLKVIPSDRTRIPDPSSAINLINATYTAADGVLAMTADFSAADKNVTFPAGTKLTEMDIQAGAIIYNDVAGTPKAYTVTGVTSDTVLTVDLNTTGGAADTCYMFANSTNGCILYVGTAGNLTMRMAAHIGSTTTAAAPTNQTLEFKNLPNASFLPTQAIQVTTATTASDIIALF